MSRDFSNRAGDCSQTEFAASVRMSRTLYKIACKADLTSPRKGIKEQRGRTARPSRYSDDFVLAAIRTYRAGGETIVGLAQKLGIPKGALSGWIGGLNRRHLLARVEREERNAA
jgi:hypothetical protein